MKHNKLISKLYEIIESIMAMQLSKDDSVYLFGAIIDSSNIPEILGVDITQFDFTNYMQLNLEYKNNMFTMSLCSYQNSIEKQIKVVYPTTSKEVVDLFAKLSSQYKIYKLSSSFAPVKI